MVDKIPFINTKEPSSITFNGEYASLVPGIHTEFCGKQERASYLDDFEASRSMIDIKSAISWQISGTPQQFPESRLNNDLQMVITWEDLLFIILIQIFPDRKFAYT